MDKIIYLDNAATSWPKPETVYNAVNLSLRKMAGNPGRSGFSTAAEAGKMIFQARQCVRSLFNASSRDNVIFSLNGTDALNIAIKGLLKSGDHVITSHLEHNSVYRPLNKLKKERGIDFSLVSHDKNCLIYPDEIKKLIRPESKLIIINHASNVLGTIQPIAAIGKIAREHGIILLVDAAQSAGAIPVDFREMNIDMMALPGHKGLMGPSGTGVLVFREGIELDSFREGGTGSFSEATFQPLNYPDRLEAGTLNTAGIAGLKAGVDFLASQGIAKIMKHERKLTQILIEELSSISGVKLYGSHSSVEKVGVVSFVMDGFGVSELTALLDTGFAIACRGGLHCAPLAHNLIGTFPEGTVRLSPGFFNSKDDMIQTIEAISALAG